MVTHTQRKRRRQRDDDVYSKEKQIKLPKIKPVCASMRDDKQYPFDDMLSELGITGFLSDNDECEDELISVFPTPSPQDHRHFTISNRLKTGSKFSHPEITKNRAITLFDSPEDGNRGLSNLGLRLKKLCPLDVGQASGEGYFNYVADEVVLAIFKMMPKSILVKCARVCRRWKRLAYDDSLWRRIDLSNKILPPGALGNCVLNRGNEIVRLSNTEISDPIYSHKLLRICKLQHLDLSMATISMKGLTELFSNCKHLKKLSLESLVVNEEIVEMISCNNKLTTINFAMVGGLTFKSLNMIFQCCKELLELNISWIKLSQTDVQLTAVNLPETLRRLNFSGCRENINDSDVRGLVSSCPHLIELDLSDSLGLTEKSVEYIQQSLADLQMLHLSRCYYIIPESLKALRRCPHLASVNVFSMMQEENLLALRNSLSGINVNCDLFSTVARPTVGQCRTSIWGLRVRDIPV